MPRDNKVNINFTEKHKLFVRESELEDLTKTTQNLRLSLESFENKLKEIAREQDIKVTSPSSFGVAQESASHSDLSVGVIPSDIGFDTSKASPSQQKGTSALNSQLLEPAHQQSFLQDDVSSNSGRLSASSYQPGVEYSEFYEDPPTKFGFTIGDEVRIQALIELLPNISTQYQLHGYVIDFDDELELVCVEAQYKNDPISFSGVFKRHTVDIELIAPILE